MRVFLMQGTDMEMEEQKGEGENVLTDRRNKGCYLEVASSWWMEAMSFHVSLKWLKWCHFSSAFKIDLLQFRKPSVVFIVECLLTHGNIGLFSINCCSYYQQSLIEENINSSHFLSLLIFHLHFSPVLTWSCRQAAWECNLKVSISAE